MIQAKSYQTHYRISSRALDTLLIEAKEMDFWKRTNLILPLSCNGLSESQRRKLERSFRRRFKCPVIEHHGPSIPIVRFSRRHLLVESLPNYRTRHERRRHRHRIRVVVPPSVRGFHEDGFLAFLVEREWRWWRRFRWLAIGIGLTSSRWCTERSGTNDSSWFESSSD